MARYDLSAEIKKNEKLSDDVFLMTILAPEIARAARPGQFCMLSVNGNLRSDPLLRRPLSIFDSGDSGDISFLYKVTGRGTDILSQKKEGDSLDIIGPLGRGFRLDHSGPRILAGGGMGVAPLHFLAKRLEGAFSVILGAKTKGEILPVVKTFEASAERLLITTEDGSLGEKGLVTAMLEKELCLSKKNVLIHTCGPWPMMRAVHDLTVKFGTRCEASLEAGMACGIGACLGCAVKKTSGGYLHVCKDGPVTDSTEIDWEI
ncbi:MAG: dihydroorotate dehydrogenase electron transfer subunit [Dissulfurimicrobium sp.]|uniref:dihydroorotate dehydrogenase electron transfer subunit n=1 Tax=Dissulfurimicrobium TaxID=1769732 RepID=UPI001EDA8AE9|nr:dihydroorotate dehydrogenase electron transfer subunit [Dissulfurimicrobium hydrothermale]UKL14303.1 dihydroorotate dehydrogenase electron transfer subunit [Dissulfurimicrobium hydrothermale]